MLLTPEQIARLSPNPHDGLIYQEYDEEGRTGRYAISPTPVVETLAHLQKTSQALEEALLIALPYVEDVLGNPEQLACFKKGAVQRHVKQIRAALQTVP